MSNADVRETFERHQATHGDNVAEILTGRDLGLCLGVVRSALRDETFDPMTGVCSIRDRT